MDRLKDKVAIITGGSKGLGEEIAKCFAQEGAKVAICGDIDIASGERVVSEVRAKGGDIEFYRCDVTKEDQVVDFFRKVEERFGKIDILVNNAGATGPGENPDEITMEGYDMVMDLDARGSFICAKHVIQYFRKIGGGNIINMASICALKAEVPGLAPYHIAKAAVLMMSKVFAMSNIINK